MHYSLSGITRKFLSLAALCLPLTLLVLSACGGGGGGGGSGSVSPGSGTATGGGGGSGGTGGTSTPVTVASGVAATIVIGQTTFTGSAFGTTATTLHGPFGNATVDPATGNLYIGDQLNNRLLQYAGIPAASGVSATQALGQSSFTTNTPGTSTTALSWPTSPVISGGKMFFIDQQNNRVGIYNSLPTSSPGTLSVVVGQSSPTSNTGGCNAAALNGPMAVSVGGGKMVVADTYNHRVLIWTTLPTSNGAMANVVLGQTGMTSCNANAGGTPAANTLNMPNGVWTDGTRLVVLDSGNNRALIWKTFPTFYGQPADLVLGQASFTTSAVTVSASSLVSPTGGVFVNGANQLFISDTYNNRVLVWNTFPTVSGQAADVVLGQASFTTNTAGTSATALNKPTGVITSGSHVIVTDVFNNRVLIY